MALWKKLWKSEFLLLRVWKLWKNQGKSRRKIKKLRQDVPKLCEKSHMEKKNNGREARVKREAEG